MNPLKIELNFFYLGFVLLMVFFALAFPAWLVTRQAYDAWVHSEPIPGGFSWVGVIAIDIAALLLYAAFLRVVYSDARIAISDECISKPKLLGKTVIHWVDVTRMDLAPPISCALFADKKSIHLKLTAYKNVDEILSAIKKLLLRGGKGRLD